MNDIAKKICEEARRLPESLAREVLSFIEFVEFKHRLKLNDPQIDELMKSQKAVMDNIWDNTEDEVWNDM
jgi:hypothetical protein